MSVKVSLGLSKKMGLPDYGSLGASCHVEVELDGTILQNDLEKFHQHVRRAYQACAQAVNEELSRHRDQATGNGSVPTNGQGANGINGNGHSKPNGNGHRAATQPQIKAIFGMARDRHLDVGQLMERYGVKKPEDLDIKTASQVIENLKSQEEKQRS